MINQIIIIIIICLPHFVQPEIRIPFYILYFLSLFVFAKHLFISKKILILVAPVILILLIGLLYTPQYKINDIALESSRIVGFIFCILAGYTIYRHNCSVRSFLRILIIVCILICSKFIFDFISNLAVINILSFNEWRKVVRGGGMIASIGTVLILNVISMKIKLFKFQKLILPIGLLLCTASLILSMSRTALVSFLIIFVIMFDLHKKIPKIIIWTLIIFISLLILFTIPIQKGIDFSNIPFAYHFFEKLQDPFSELRLKSYDSITQMSQNWRGYESYRSWDQYRNGNVVNYLIGSGFGSKIDIGLNMVLNKQTYNKILVTHNGYLYLLVKTGLIGLLSYLTFIVMSLFTSYKIYKSTNNHLLKLLTKFSFSLISVVLISTYIGVGFIDRGNISIVLIILGYIAAYKINTESYTN